MALIKGVKNASDQNKERMEKYQIIYADPPWQFKNWSDNWHKSSSKSKWVAKHYEIQTTDDIYQMPISDIADKNSVLLIWATMPRLPDCLKVIDAWGFQYKTNAFTWVKRNKKADSLFWGMGYYTRSNVEICLLATKGKPLKRLRHDIHSVIESSIMKHSQKPVIARERITDLFGDLHRIELFAREKVDGWDCWGNEVEGVDIL